MKKKLSSIILLSTFILLAGCTETESTPVVNEETKPKEEIVDTAKANNETKETIVAPVEEPSKEKPSTDTVTKEKVSVPVDEKPKEKEPSVPVVKETPAQPTSNQFAGYKKIDVKACELSGSRQAKVVVDIGYGDREYWAFTNEHGQLVRVTAAKIILQDDRKESVTSSGRYCNDEAKVPGVESDTLDEGHVIADSLGGVSNAYNITPQDSTLNRHGDQAYMERAIRDAGGATNFEAIITYPNTKTQIPSHYQYTYTIKGNKIVDSFDNGNPDKVNESLGLTETKPKPTPAPSTSSPATGDLSSVDTNGNGKVTIKEAKDAGFKMPITRDHWLYQYMDDRDGDGVVGE